MPTIHWFRRDLRLADNQALHMAAHESDGQVIPLFVVDPTLVQSARVGPNRLAWLAARLRTLHAELATMGSGLVIAYGNPVDVIHKLCQQHTVTSVHWQRDTAPWARRRDYAVGMMLRDINVRGVMHDTLTIVPAQQVLTDKGTPYTVFTPYYRRWRAQLNLGEAFPVPSLAPVTHLATGEFPSWPESTIAIADTSRQQALQLLMHFGATRIDGYAEQRNYPAQPGSAQLSAYLRFGVLSAHECARMALAQPDTTPKSGADVWLSQLAWRDFYQQILWHFPHVVDGAFRPVYDNIAWPNDERLFAAWCHGQTGYPIVDAAMRQLVQTGWMHNRARMIVASFLTKDLLIDWRWGERFFMQHLIDGDTA
ncbi:MAG: cryptochrome/photolyase family protein, partial [Roseiflexaceae bacterium]